MGAVDPDVDVILGSNFWWEMFAKEYLGREASVFSHPSRSVESELWRAIN